MSKGEMTYLRECPKCSVEISYTNKRSWYNAKARDSQCKPCQNKSNSEYFSGRPRTNYSVTRRSKLEPTKWLRNCPDCNKVLYYSTNWNLMEAVRKGTVCDSCANYKYKKTWNNVITEDHIKQMRATKSGFKDWNEYEEKMPDEEFDRRIWEGVDKYGI